ncbi:leucine-rich repeat domain-containing protein [Sorangium sp. So ce1335]|uniref:leucine-rich repeat domain-containing protein n=1 Tax=Sorangium sp. So ce1335 TaxID=3133335 RepID=UPI003F62D763
MRPLNTVSTLCCSSALSLLVAACGISSLGSGAGGDGGGDATSSSGAGNGSSSSSGAGAACRGPDPTGCKTQGCPAGQTCVDEGCAPSSCECDPATGTWYCTDDCGGGTCVPDEPACRGPNPAGCKAQGCPAGQTCVDEGCTPSSCECDPATGTWYCTDDCGGGTCVQGCDPEVREGSVLVTSQAELEQLRGVTALRGTLEITRRVTDLSPLECLTTIDGNLTISDNPALRNLDGLRSLEEVAGTIMVSENPLLESVAGVAVKAHTWYVAHNASLESLSGFEEVEAGVLWLEANARLANLSALGNLRQGAIMLIDNDALTSLEGINASQLDGLRILRNDGLVSLKGLEALESVGILELEENQNLSSLEGLEKLRTADNLRLWVNENLSSLEGLESLVHVGFLDIAGNAELADLTGLTSLESLGSLNVSSNPALVSLDGAPALRAVEHVVIDGNPELVSVSAFAQLRPDQDPPLSLHLIGNPKLTSIDIGRVTRLGELYLYHLPLTDLSAFAGVSELVRLSVADNPELVSLTGVEQISGLFILEVAHNPRLTSLEGLSGLRFVESGISIVNNLALTTLDGLGPLSSGDTGANVGVILEDNPRLVDIDALRGIERMSHLVVTDNDALLDLTGLEDASELQSLIIKDNLALTTLRGLGARSISSMDVTGNQRLTSCEIAAFVAGLEHVGSVREEGNATGPCPP